MEKKTISMLAVLGVAVLLSVSLVFAYQGNPDVKGPNYSEERHESMVKAFESGDYATWKELMTQDGRHPRVVDVVTEDNFNKFVEMHEAMESGNTELVQEIRAELGLGQGRMAHRGHGNGMKGQRMANCPMAD